MAMPSSSFSNRARRGKTLESLVALSCGSILCVTKMEAGMRWAGGKPIPVAGPVDYVGSVVASGRMVCFDAKESHEHGSFPLSKVPQHQIEYLRKHGAGGALAGLLVGATHSDIGLYLWLDWSHLSRFVGRVDWGDPAWVELGMYGQVIKWERLLAKKTD